MTTTPSTVRYFAQQAGWGSLVGALVGTGLLWAWSSLASGDSAPRGPSVEAPRVSTPAARADRPTPAAANAVDAAEVARRAVLVHDLAVLQSEIATLEAQRSAMNDAAALHDTLLAGLASERNGDPVPWSPRVPPQYRPELFIPMVRNAISNQALATEYVSAECDEFPCIAMLRNRESQSRVMGTPEWQASFGKNGVGMVVLWVDCEGGPRERVELLNPIWDFTHDPGREPLDESLSESPEAMNLSVRLEQRRTRILADWTCASGAPGHAPE